MKDVLKGVAVSVPITFASGLLGIPIGFALMTGFVDSLGLPGFVLAFALVPLLANIFAWRAYMPGGRATQYSILVSGVVLSFVFALGFSMVLLLSFFSAA